MGYPDEASAGRFLIEGRGRVVYNEVTQYIICLPHPCMIG